MIAAQHLVYGFNNNLDSNPFSIRVKTDNAGTSASNQFTLPLQVIAGLTYDFFVDWGDGEFTSHNTTANVTHTFPSAGVYDIKIYGKFEKIYFSNAGDKLKLLAVLQWGDYYGRFSNQTNAFLGCSNVTSIADDCDVLNEFLTNGQNAFYGCKLSVLPSTMTLSSLTNGNSMFYNNQLTSLPSVMTLSSLTNGNSMFYNNQLTSLPSVMVLDSLTIGVDMFRQNQLTSLPSGMALNSLTNGNSMFTANQLTSLPSGMTLSSLTNGQDMFNTNQLTSLPSGMTLSSLTNGQSMFNANQLTEAPYLNMPNVTNLAFFVRNNPNFNGSIAVGTQSITNVSAMVWGTKFNQDISSWNFNFNCDFAQANFNPGFTSMTGAWMSNENWGRLLVRVNEKCGAGLGRTIRKCINTNSGTKYPAFAAAARAALIADGWDIRDGGAE